MVPRVLLAELQQEELDRVAQEEEEEKLRAMLAREEEKELGETLDREAHPHHHLSASGPHGAKLSTRPRGRPDTLSVTIIQCRKLLPADLDGLADPLVVCWCAPMCAPRHYTYKRSEAFH